jgi:hypothetical protein
MKKDAKDMPKGVKSHAQTVFFLHKDNQGQPLTRFKFGYPESAKTISLCLNIREPHGIYPSNNCNLLRFL